VVAAVTVTALTTAVAAVVIMRAVVAAPARVVMCVHMLLLHVAAAVAIV
jgi:hypothetical protein